MKKFLTSLATTFLFASLSSPLLAENLISVYKQAFQNDPQFRAARAAYRAQLESKNQSLAALLPTISASAHYTQNDNETTGGTIPSSNNYKTNGYSLTLTQPLYRRENYIGLNQSDAQVSQAIATFSAAKQNLVLRVATQYFSVLAAEDDLAFAKAERKSIREQLIQTEQRFNVGLIAITDVHEAKARFDQAVARAIVAENTLAISKESLREITATNYSALAILSVTHPLIKPQPADVSQWVTTANIQNAFLLATRKGVEIAQSEVALQSAGHYPTLDLSARHTYTDYSSNYNFGSQDQNNNIISLQLKIPLYQGGLVSSRTRAAAYRLAEAREKLEQQKRSTEKQTRSSYLSVIANISQVKALKQALASSSIALEATQAGFEVGTRTAVDVLNSQRELFRARRNYAQARYNYVLETLKLKNAAGTLDFSDLEKINPWLK